MPSKSFVAAVALVLGATNMATHMAFGRGMSGGPHFVGGGIAGHRLAISHGFVRPSFRSFAFRNGFAFRRNFTTGGWWPYYDYVTTDGYGDMTYPEGGGFVPESTPAAVCNRSEEVVRVPSERGGTRQIKIIRCP